MNLQLFRPRSYFFALFFPVNLLKNPNYSVEISLNEANSLYALYLSKDWKIRKDLLKTCSSHNLEGSCQTFGVKSGVSGPAGLPMEAQGRRVACTSLK